MIINNNMGAINANRTSEVYALGRGQEYAEALLRSSYQQGRRRCFRAAVIGRRCGPRSRDCRQAERNTEDGMSFVQTAEGYLNQSAQIIQRIRVLSVQAANGIYSNEDRQLIQVEVSALVDEVDRIASQAEFNRFKVLTGEFSKVNPKASMWFHMGANANQRERIYIGTMTAQSFKLRDGTVRDVYPTLLASRCPTYDRHDGFGVAAAFQAARRPRGLLQQAVR